MNKRMRQMQKIDAIDFFRLFNSRTQRCHKNKRLDLILTGVYGASMLKTLRGYNQ